MEEIKKDYTITDPQERSKLVEQIIQSTPPEKRTPAFLDSLGDYILEASIDKKEKTILSQNRMKTINKRETSYEGVVSKFEGGEDSVYNLIIDDRNIILSPKVTITDKDIAEVPGLAALRKAIEETELDYQRATGRRKHLLKKHIILMRQDQYALKNSYFQPVRCTKTTKSSHKINYDEKYTIDKDGEPHCEGLISLLNPEHISAILCHYSLLKQYVDARKFSDLYFILEEFDKNMAAALADYPMYQDLVNLKFNNRTNADIQAYVKKEFNINHTTEYLSCLWRKKIPKLIAEQGKINYLYWYYTYQEYGQWKRCSRCGEIKLAHPKFFSKNKTSKDGYYSVCKKCRNKKPNQIRIERSGGNG